MFRGIGEIRGGIRDVGFKSDKFRARDTRCIIK